MNNKKWILLSIFALMSAVVRPNNNENSLQALFAVETPKPAEVVVPVIAVSGNEEKLYKMHALTAIPGILVGGFTGLAIGYMSGKFFDESIGRILESATSSIDAEKRPFLNKHAVTLLLLTRLTTQLGCKYWWEKSLRNKLITWAIADARKCGVKCNEEAMKTIARVSAYVGFATQV